MNKWINKIIVGVRKLTKLLTKMCISFEREQSFDGMRYKLPLFADFYLTDSNVILEQDGEQHFRIIEHWGGINSLIDIQIRDCIKDLYCLQNGISLMRIPYNVTITEEMIKNFLKFCEDQQVYMSYTQYYENVSEFVDFNLIKVILISSP